MKGANFQVLQGPVFVPGTLYVPTERGGGIQFLKEACPLEEAPWDYKCGGKGSRVVARRVKTLLPTPNPSFGSFLRLCFALRGDPGPPFTSLRWACLAGKFGRRRIFNYMATCTPLPPTAAYC